MTLRDEWRPGMSGMQPWFDLWAAVRFAIGEWRKQNALARRYRSDIVAGQVVPARQAGAR